MSQPSSVPDEPSNRTPRRAAVREVVVAADAGLGRSRSLMAGVAATPLPARVVDLRQHAVRQPENAARSINEEDSQPRGQKSGNPVEFRARAYAALTRIEDDTGAHHVLAASDHVRYFDVDDAGVLMDIDRPPGCSASA